MLIIKEGSFSPSHPTLAKWNEQQQQKYAASFEQETWAPLRATRPCAREAVCNMEGESLAAKWTSGCEWTAPGPEPAGREGGRGEEGGIHGSAGRARQRLQPRPAVP